MKQKKLAVLNRFLMLAINLLYVLLVVYFIGHYIEVKSLPMCSNEIMLLMILTIIKSCQTIIPSKKKTSVTVFGKKITKSTKKKIQNTVRVNTDLNNSLKLFCSCSLACA